MQYRPRVQPSVHKCATSDSTGGAQRRCNRHAAHVNREHNNLVEVSVRLRVRVGVTLDVADTGAGEYTAGFMLVPLDTWYTMDGRRYLSRAMPLK